MPSSLIYKIGLSSPRECGDSDGKDNLAAVPSFQVLPPRRLVLLKRHEATLNVYLTGIQAES